MRTLGFVAAVTALLAPATAPAATDDPGAVLKAAAEQCLRSNAVRVTPATQTLTEAVSFLVEDLCATEIARSVEYRTSMKMLAAMQANPPKPQFTTSAAHPTLGAFEEQQNANADEQARLVKQLRVDSASGELITPPGFDPTFALRATTMFGPIFSVAFAQADFKAIAAQAVLEAKEAAARR
jgi:hypothetical protein